jgi:uncharacterized protein (DUF1501 family)
MLRILGSPKRACDGLTRRDLLVGGTVELLGLGLSGRAPAAPSAPPRRARSVICLFLFGGVSSIDTFDPKPEAPAEVRGEFTPIATTVPGLRISNYLPLLAQRMHRLALVRSVTSTESNHDYCTTLTGHPGHISLLIPSDGDWPFFMSALEYLRDRDGRQPRLGLPANFCLPNRINVLQGTPQAGPYGGFLGHRYDPVCSRAGRPGDAMNRLDSLRNQPLDFALPGTQLAPDLTLDHLDRRRSLLQQLDSNCRVLDAQASVEPFQRGQELALDLMTSPATRRALDLSREPNRLRERYGWNLFGQTAFMARRLIEAGVPLVTAVWDSTKNVNIGADVSHRSWDTHWDHYKACKGWLLPGFDQTASALLDDLSDRGLLDETLVVCLTEMGKTPRLNEDAGRDHWVAAYCALFSGAGIHGGTVHGRTDRLAAFVAADRVAPQDLLATVYHLMGYGQETTIYDRQRRAIPLYDNRRPIRSVLA